MVRKIYVTLNGFHLSSQIEGLKRHILKLREMKPDAFIVASVGAMRLVKELAPEIFFTCFYSGKYFKLFRCSSL